MIALLWTVAQGAWAKTDITTVSTEEELRTAVQTNGAIIRLGAEIQLSKYLDINNQVHVTIDLYGHKLSRSLTEYDRAGHVIWVHGNSELTLKSSIDGGSIKAFVLNFGEETGIREISKESRSQGVAGHWFSLDGRRLGSKPTDAGIYIHNGRKVLIK